MVHVRAFQGFVVKKELAQKLIAPPYDVLDSAEARVMSKGNDVVFNGFLFIFIIKYF